MSDKNNMPVQAEHEQTVVEMTVREMTVCEQMKKPAQYKVKRADLIKYPWLKDDVKKINARIKALRTQMAGHSANIEGGGSKTNTNNDNVSYLASKIADLERRKNVLEGRIKAIRHSVALIPDESAKRLIIERYFKQKHWKEICKEYGLKRSTAQARAEKYIE